MASSHHFADSRQVSARVAPPLRCCAVPLLLPVRAHPYGRPCTTPSISLVVNIMYIETFCEHLNIIYILDQTDLYRLEVRLELNGTNACLIVSPPSLSPSHPPTPPPSRDGQLSPLYPPSPSSRSCGAACVKLCCLPPTSLCVKLCCLPPTSLVRNIRLCCLV